MRVQDETAPACRPCGPRPSSRFLPRGQTPKADTVGAAPAQRCGPGRRRTQEKPSREAGVAVTVTVGSERWPEGQQGEDIRTERERNAGTAMAMWLQLLHVGAVVGLGNLGPPQKRL